ncbi:MAG: beta-propeller fold lactonase family protein [Verrucomicrobiota bacterium]
MTSPRILSLILAFCTASSPILSAKTLVHVSCGKDNEVRTYTIDESKTELTLVGTTPVKSPRMQWRHSGRPFLFVASADDTVTTLSFAGGQDVPEVKSTAPTAGSSSYLCTDPAGEFLFSASFRTGEVSVYPLTEGGTVGEVIQVLSQPVKSHCILPDPSGKYFLVPHTMPVNRIDQFRFDREKQELVPNDPPYTSPPIDTGPRHLAISQDGRHVYSSNEQGISATFHRLDPETGLLTEVQTVSTFEDGKPEELMSCSDVELTPDERFLFVASREKKENGLSSVSCFAVNADDGTLSFTSRTPVDAVPRSFNITPDGKYMIVASQMKHTLTLFTIDPDNGRLTQKQQLGTGQGPGWVLTRHQSD